MTHSLEGIWRDRFFPRSHRPVYPAEFDHLPRGKMSWLPERGDQSARPWQRPFTHFVPVRSCLSIARKRICIASIHRFFIAPDGSVMCQSWDQKLTTANCGRSSKAAIPKSFITRRLSSTCRWTEMNPFAAVQNNLFGHIHAGERSLATWRHHAHDDFYRRSSECAQHHGHVEAPGRTRALNHGRQYDPHGVDPPGEMFWHRKVACCRGSSNRSRAAARLQ